MEVIHLAVNGTLMQGLALNGNLLAVGASFVCKTQTEPAYRLWSIDDNHPAMLRVATGGQSIAVGSGIPALLGFMGIIGATMGTSFKYALPKDTDGLIVVVAIGIILCLLSGWLDLVFYEPRISLLLWSLLGSMDGLVKVKKL